MICLVCLVSSCAPPHTTADTSQNALSFKLATAEAFVDAFYSYDPDQLEVILSSASKAKPSILFYQGWAEGANYKVLNRMPCEVKGEVIGCSITVRDDLLLALGSDFNVTDRFDLTFSGESIVNVTTDSDDPELVHTAIERVFDNQPGLAGGACIGYFDGGPTPGDCARAVVQGLLDFAARDDFPGLP